MGTVSDKLTYLNGTKQKLKEVINATGGNLTNESTFRSYATVLNQKILGAINGEVDLYSEYPKVTGEGTDFVLNSEKGKIDFILKGNSSQKTTLGKNLLKILNLNSTFSGVQVTTNPDKSVTLNGTCTSNYAINIITNWSLSLENGKTYTLSGCPNLGGRDVLSLELYSNSPSNQYITDIGSGKTFTLTADRTYRCYIPIKAGQTYDNVTLYPMVEEGPQVTEYEPYTGGIPSPNPDYPQDIKVVTGEQNITISQNGNTQTYPINLGNIELSKIGNYLNYIYNDNGNWYLHQEIYKYIVTGNETFNNSFGVNLFAIRDAFKQVPFVTGYGLSNYYKYNSIQSGINANTSNGDFVLQYDRGYYSLFFKNTSFDNVTDFKNDLQDKYNNDNPIIIMFPLENPTDIQITDTTLIQQLDNLNNAISYKGKNSIICVSLNPNNEIVVINISALKPLDI